MQRTLFRYLKYLLLGIPLIWGVTGFYRAGESLPDSLFMAICLYGMEVQESTPNLSVELARWTAPLATASGVLMLFSSVRQKIHNIFLYLTGDSVAVYGAAEEKAALLNQLGRFGIDGGEINSCRSSAAKCQHSHNTDSAERSEEDDASRRDSRSSGRTRLALARRYVLLGKGEENLALYQRNQKAFQNHITCIQCSSLRTQEIADPALRIFCAEETAARIFWKKHCLYDLYRLSARCGCRMQLVFIGFGKLGEELLLQGLQNNIFAPTQQITYHIFGDGSDFTAIYHELASIEDEVIFHQEPWQSQLPLLEQAQVLIVLSQEEQLTLIQKLLLATNREEIHVFALENAGFRLLAGRSRIHPFYWAEEAWEPEHLWSDVLYDRAKEMNLQYAMRYSNAENTEKAKETEWRKLDAFTRYSNISAADYHEIRLKMLSSMGAAPEAESISLECRELLSELEHIRWCRYHYLNNWKRGIPDNGKNKDTAKRIHQDLVPYRELTKEEQEKDWETIETLFQAGRR